MSHPKKPANTHISYLHTKITSGQLRIVDHLNTYVQRIQETAENNAYLDVLTDAAQVKAIEIDKKIQAGNTPGKLAGTIVAIKDNICIQNVKTTCGSHILENFIPPYNATVIDKLLAEDALIIGKTNMDEFAMGSSTENSAFGASINPAGDARVPGGSSGGSAVAVAAGSAQAALGSDTGGSIRQPAAFTGVVGLKPTYGRVSRYGLIAFASSLDQIGPICTNIPDTAQVLQVISGKDHRDATSAEMDIPDYTTFLNREIKQLRIGICKDFFEHGLNGQIKDRIYQVIDFLEQAGAHIVPVDLPHSQYGVSTYYVIATAEASANLARYDGIKFGHRAKGEDNLIDTYQQTRHDGFGDEVKRRIMLGTYVLSSGYYDAYYKKAQQVRRLIKQDFDKVFEKVDCLLTPTTPTTAFKIGEKIENPLEMYLSDIYTVTANLAGIPAISLPVGMDSENLPIGLQLLAAPFAEGVLLQIGDFIEQNYTTHD